MSVRYDFGAARVGCFYGTGKNVSAQKIEVYLVSLVAIVAGGELRTSYGRLQNKDLGTGELLNKQFGFGYHYFLSRRTTVYADLINQRHDGFPDGWRETGYDLGLQHNF